MSTLSEFCFVWREASWSEAWTLGRKGEGREREGASSRWARRGPRSPLSSQFSPLRPKGKAAPWTAFHCAKTAREVSSTHLREESREQSASASTRGSVSCWSPSRGVSLICKKSLPPCLPPTAVVSLNAFSLLDERGGVPDSRPLSVLQGRVFPPRATSTEEGRP